MSLFVLLGNRHQTAATESFGQWVDTEVTLAEPIHLGAAPQCEACGHYLGRLKWLPPYSVELTILGNQFGDLAFGASDDLLGSERFVQEMSRAGVTGLADPQPVNLVRVKRRGRVIRARPAYYRITIARLPVFVDDRLSEIIREPDDSADFCPECRNGWRGIRSGMRIVMVDEKVPPVDVFRAKNLPGRILCSERFVETCLAAGLSNAVFVSANQLSWNHYAWEAQM